MRLSIVLLVFAASFLALAWRQDSLGIAEAYSDPIAKIRAQDESSYADAAIRMSRDGDWMTPIIMGRPFLQKPPLLFWLAGLSIKILGLSLFAIRLPALLLGAAAVAGIFAWATSARGTAAGILAAGLLVFSPFWQIFSKLCYTDIPAGACAVLAMTAVALDPQFQRRRTPLLFGAIGALSILSKSVAGLLPFAALGIYWILLPAGRRPRLARLAIVAISAAFVLAPWHIYESLVHPQWFFADYIQVQVLGVGLQTLGPSIFNRSSTYYIARLAQMDPLLGALVLIALPGAVRKLWARQDSIVLLVCCWLGITAVALTAFQAKNVPYMVLLVPPLCLLAVLCGPQWLYRNIWIAMIGLVVIFAAHLALQPAVPRMDGAAAMRSYYALSRDTGLISCEPEDEFYSATLPLPHTRYCFVDPAGVIARSVPHYAPLGIVITAEQFQELPSLTQAFLQELRRWHYDSAEPIGTTITLKGPEQIAMILRAHTDLDFCLPEQWNAFFGETHEIHHLAGHHAYLLSRTAKLRTPPLPAIPTAW